MATAAARSRMAVRTRWPGKSIASTACGWYGTGPGPMTPCNTIGQSEAELSNPDRGEPGHEQPGGNYSWVQSGTVDYNSSTAFGFGAGLRYDPGYWEWMPAAPTMPAESCGWNPFCNFLDGFGNLFLSGGNRRQGITQLAGAEAVGVAGVFSGGAVAAPAREFGSSAVGYASSALGAAYTNPELLESLGQFVEGIDSVVPTRWGAAGAASKIIWDHRDWIEGQFRGSDAASHRLAAAMSVL